MKQVQLNDAEISTLQKMGLEVVEGGEVVLSDKVAAVVTQQKMSDSQGFIFQRQLESIEAPTYDVLYADLEARECFIQNSFGGPNAKFLTYRSFDRVGSAKVINGRATDFPKADISGKEYTIEVKNFGTSYDIDIDEAEAAQMAGIPLEARRAEAAKRGYEELINEIAFFGGEGLNGFFSHANGIAKSAPAKSLMGAGAGTPLECAAMLHSFINDIYASTKKIHKAEFLWMPVDFFHYISSTPVSETYVNETILSYFLRTNMYIRNESQIKSLNTLAEDELAKLTAKDSVNWASSAVKGGLLVAGQMHVAGRETCRMRETLPLQFFPVQIRGLVYEIPARGKFAGVEVTYAGAFRFMNITK